MTLRTEEALLEVQNLAVEKCINRFLGLLQGHAKESCLREVPITTILDFPPEILSPVYKFSSHTALSRYTYEQQQQVHENIRTTAPEENEPKISRWKLSHAKWKRKEKRFCEFTYFILPKSIHTAATVPSNGGNLPPHAFWSALTFNEKTPDCPILKSLPYFGDDQGMEDNSYLRHYEYVDIPSESDEEDQTLCDTFYGECVLQKMTDPRLPFTLAKTIPKLNRRRLLRFSSLTQYEDILSGGSHTKAVADPEESFQFLFCKRCFIFDCQLHPESVPKNCFLKLKHLLPKLKLSRLSFEKEFCGQTCFKRCSSLNGFEGPPRNPLEADMVTEGALLWNEVEKQKLQRIQKVLASNEDYCNISRLFLDKKCFEVAQYCRSLVEDDPQRKNQVPRELQVETLEPQTEVYRSSLYNYYSGCQHEDSKCERKCGCYMGKRKCDKYCGCDPLKCKNYFTGCRCVGTGCRTKGCPCFAANTECDPDLCTICGSCDYYDGPCTNNNIQKGIKKRLFVGPSEIAGWGVFAGESFENGDFVAEYTGEIISQNEAERRGIVYDLRKLSFLFNLNRDFVVDATKSGSKIRFANHSMSPSCQSKVMVVGGTLRIGLFALKRIPLGTEITFNYNYEEAAKKFISNDGPPLKKKRPVKSEDGSRSVVKLHPALKEVKS